MNDVIQAELDMIMKDISSFGNGVKYVVNDEHVSFNVECMRDTYKRFLYNKFYLMSENYSYVKPYQEKDETGSVISMGFYFK